MREEELGRTVVIVAVNDVVTAWFGMADTLKPGVHEVTYDEIRE